MRKIALFVLFLMMTTLMFAGKIDENVLSKITGTKWELKEEKKYGRVFHKKNKTPIKEVITFSDGSILFDLSDQNYACNFTLKNKVEFWMYCTEPDQYIYKIQSLNSRELVMDMFVKDRSGKYIKTKRLTFHTLP